MKQSKKTIELLLCAVNFVPLPHCIQLFHSTAFFRYIIYQDRNSLFCFSFRLWASFCEHFGFNHIKKDFIILNFVVWAFWIQPYKKRILLYWTSLCGHFGFNHIKKDFIILKFIVWAFWIQPYKNDMTKLKVTTTNNASEQS